MDNLDRIGVYIPATSILGILGILYGGSIGLFQKYALIVSFGFLTGVSLYDVSRNASRLRTHVAGINTSRISSKTHGLENYVSERICTGCGAQMESEEDFCMNCGKKWEAKSSTPPICSKCGRENRLSAKFCAKCGLKLT